MTSAQTSTLVFKDQAGEYYLVPQELLEQGRVPQEHKAEIEHLIAEQQDVQGYLMVRKAGKDQQEYTLVPPPLLLPLIVVNIVEQLRQPSTQGTHQR